MGGKDAIFDKLGDLSEESYVFDGQHDADGVEEALNGAHVHFLGVCTSAVVDHPSVIANEVENFKDL